MKTQSRRNIGDNAAIRLSIPPAGKPIIILYLGTRWRGGEIAILERRHACDGVALF